MTDMDSHVLLVEALYQYKAKNNDELCFKKGSIITVTQNDDESWWEGTLNDNTGWFPANYVKPYKPSGHESIGASVDQGSTVMSPNSEQQMFRAMILRNLLDSELQHITDLNSLISSCLKRLASSKVLGGSEFSTLLSNLERVVAAHKNLLSKLEAEGEKPSADQRVGGVFLSSVGDTLSVPHQQYCSQHPKAVAYLQEHHAEINRCVEDSGLCQGDDGMKKPGLLVLTTGLSKPFRRLQQYSGLLQELHRHLPEAHKDRGDANRAAKVMADLASSCNSMRRQKELELEVVTGQIAGWEKGTLGVLGDVQLMGSVALMPKHTDSYLVLFPMHLIILGVSSRMSNFIFQSQHNRTDIVCRKLEDCDTHKNAFELTGPKMDRIVAVCQSKSEQQQWVAALCSSSPSYHAKPLKGSPPFRDSKGSVPVQPPLPPHKSTLGSPGHVLGNGVTARHSSVSHKPWGLCDLRPSPPLRPHQLKKIRASNKDVKCHDEDNIILRVVEAYCSSTAAPRYTHGHPGEGNLFSEDSRLKRSNTGSGISFWDNKSVLSVVDNLKAEFSKLSREHENLRLQFEKDRQERNKLQAALAHLLPMN